MSINTHGLDVILGDKPKVVCVVGASEKELHPGVARVPRNIFENLLPYHESVPGAKIIPINPVRKEILGYKAYPNLLAVPDEKIDVVVNVIGSDHFPEILEMITQAHKKDVSAIVMPTSGFSETGPAGVEMENQIVSALTDEKGHQIRLIGTNCIGVLCPHIGFNATFCAMPAKAGGMAFFSNSGAVAGYVVSDSIANNFGFRYGVSIGSSADVNVSDLMAYASNDPFVTSVFLYLESVKNPKDFFKAADMLRKKNIPVFAIKSGRSEAGGKAAMSHTGAMVGGDDAVEAALRRAGIARIDVGSTMEDFSNVALLANNTLWKIKRGKYNVFNLSHAGGTGVLKTDTICHKGGILGKFLEETVEKLNAVLAKYWSHGNPADMTGGATEIEYGNAVKIMLQAPEVDILHVNMQPLGVVRPTDVAQDILNAYAEHGKGKPMVATLAVNIDDWKKEGDGNLKKARKMLTDAGIPNINNDESAARAIQYLIRREKLAEELDNAREKPEIYSHGTIKKLVKEKLNDIRKQGRYVLTTDEALALFDCYNIPVVETAVAQTEKEAILTAKEIDYPVVLKLRSKTEEGSHKTDIGGVELNLKNAEAVKEAFREIKKSVTEKIGAEHFQGVTVQPMADMSGSEILLGKTTDSVFGPIITFGWGGTDTEIISDKIVTMPGLTRETALTLIKETKVYKKLKGARGKPPANIEAVVDAFVAISQIAQDFPEIDELDINPLIANEKGVLVVDGRVKLHKIGADRESAIE
jgi:acetyltransferase